MKTPFIQKKLNAGHIFLAFVLSFPLFIQSCSLGHEYLAGSVDDNAPVHSGPSYPQSSPNGSDFAWNVGMVFLGIPEDPQNLRDYPDRSSLVPTQNYYASNLTGPASLDYSNWNKKTAKPDFMSQLTYMGAFEFVKKNSSDGNSKLNLNYLEVPLYAIYYTKLSTGQVFGGLGPYFAYGIGGKDGSSPAFDSTYGYKRFDAGLTLTAGYKLPSRIYFNFAYDFGLANIERNAFGDKTTNRGFSLNVAYPLARLIKMK